MTEPIADRFQPAHSSDMPWRRHLERLELELDLDPDQKPAWRSFVTVYLETRRAVEMTDTLSEQDSQDEPMSIADALASEAELLAVRVLAARRIAEAADALLKALTLRQRWRANRLLRVLAIELGLLQLGRASSREASAPAQAKSEQGAADVVQKYMSSRSSPRACGGPGMQSRGN